MVSRLPWPASLWTGPPCCLAILLLVLPPPPPSSCTRLLGRGNGSLSFSLHSFPQISAIPSIQGYGHEKGVDMIHHPSGTLGKARTVSKYTRTSDTKWQSQASSDEWSLQHRRCLSNVCGQQKGNTEQAAT